MADKVVRPRKAVGSNGTSRKGKSASRGRPSHRNEEPQASSKTNEGHRASSEFDRDPHMRSSALSGSHLLGLQEAQAENERRPHSASKRTTTVSANEDKTPSQPSSPTSSTSLDWQDLASDTPVPSGTPFPGTWPAALADTSTALSSVSSATLSYGSALASSGIGRASWSIGSAALSSTNKAALSLTSWGMAKTGVMPNELPAPVRKWVLAKEEKDRRRRRRAEQRTREQRLANGETVEGGFRDDKGKFVLDLHEMDSTGNFEGRGPAGRREAEEEISYAQRCGARERGEFEEEEEEEDGLLRVFDFNSDDDV